MWVEYPRTRNGIGAVNFPLISDMDNKIVKLYGID